MATNAGWQPLSDPRKRAGAAAFVISPFTRLARTHAAAVAGDTLIALALAGSLFFDIDPSAARSKVALYLALTMAPFAVVAPLIGPVLDRARGGRRLMLIGANALRAVLCVMMIGDLESLVLFPEAFVVLVLAKSYHVAKSAIVPTVVRSDDELVEANSRLSFLSGVMGFVAALPGLAMMALTGSQGVLVLATGVFALAGILGLKVPATRVAQDQTSQTERNELRGGGILLAASAMGLLRGIVGFLTFLVAFSLRTDGAPTWQFGVVLAASGIGALLGSLIAPALRRSDTSEERILQIVLAGTAVAGLLAAWAGGLVAAAVLATCIGAAASCGKLAFDSVVQRDAPDANRGRSFARFETRFQLTWVAGAFLPVLIPIPMAIGFVVVAACAAFALVSYLAGLRALDRGQMPVRRNPAEAITSRIRRRRQGFATDPAEAVSATAAPAPPAHGRGVVDMREPREVAPREGAPRRDLDIPLDDDPVPAPEPPPGAAPPDHPVGEPVADHRVIIDPTNL
ncbi:MAG TPA: MFS transporter [Acidimicrobiales bacterium]|nr:MFS transporter [Acidimicrobiales bacterium]